MSKQSTAQLDPPAEDVAPGPAGLDGMIEAATAAYRGLVRRQARDQSIDRDELDKVLIRAGRSLVQFRADSDRLKKRFAAAAQLANMEGHEEDIDAAEQPVLELKQEIQRLETDFRSKVAGLQDNLSAAESTLARKKDRRVTIRNEAVATLCDATASPQTLEQLGKLQKMLREAQGDALLSKHSQPGFQKRAVAQQQECLRRIQELQAKLRDPIAGMHWSE
jgi:hypothetical protein